MIFCNNKERYKIKKRYLPLRKGSEFLRRVMITLFTRKQNELCAIGEAENSKAILPIMIEELLNDCKHLKNTWNQVWMAYQTWH